MKYFKECFVEKIYHHNAWTEGVWDNLKPATNLNLSCNEKDSSDETIYLKYNDKTVGVLSDSDSKTLIDFIKMGHEKIFNAIIIQNKMDEVDEDRKLKVVIYIKSSGEINASNHE
ncbi:MAG: hypothetical protein MJZ78_03370 [Bacteroidales bacterium]|nr:hypothetical protein [Bacteroidales bacterium]